MSATIEPRVDQQDTYLDVTVEELVAAASLLGLDVPAVLFSEFEPPEPDVLERIVETGRRVLIVRRLLEGSGTDHYLDENLATAVELLVGGELLVLVATLGSEPSMNLLCGGDSQLVTLSSVEQAVWRVRFPLHDQAVGVIALLTNLDHGIDAALTDQELRLAFGAPRETTGSEQAMETALGAIGEADRERLATLVGSEAEFHTVIVGWRGRSDSSAAVSWSSDPVRGVFLVGVDDDALRVAPARTDEIAEQIERLL